MHSALSLIIQYNYSLGHYNVQIKIVHEKKGKGEI